MATSNAERQAKYRQAKRQAETDKQSLIAAIGASLDMQAMAVEIIQKIESGEKTPLLLETALELLYVSKRRLRHEISACGKDEGRRLG